MAPADEAAKRARVSTRAIFRLAEAGDVHFKETSDGLLLICLNSLLAFENGVARLSAESIEGD